MLFLPVSFPSARSCGTDKPISANWLYPSPKAGSQGKFLPASVIAARPHSPAFPTELTNMSRKCIRLVQSFTTTKSKRSATWTAQSRHRIGATYQYIFQTPSVAARRRRARSTRQGKQSIACSSPGYSRTPLPTLSQQTFSERPAATTPFHPSPARIHLHPNQPLSSQARPSPSTLSQRGRILVVAGWASRGMKSDDFTTGLCTEDS